MNNKIRDIPIVSDNITKVGRFIIRELIMESGLKGVGISRCSSYDKFNIKTGEEIAKGRAYKSLYNKMNKIKSQEAYVG